MEITNINSWNTLNVSNYPEKNHSIKVEPTHNEKEPKKSAIFDIVIDPLAKASPDDTYLEKTIKEQMQYALKEQEQDNKKEKAEEQRDTAKEIQFSSAQSSESKSLSDSDTQVKTDVKLENIPNTNTQTTSSDNKDSQNISNTQIAKNTISVSNSINIIV